MGVVLGRRAHFNGHEEKVFLMRGDVLVCTRRREEYSCTLSDGRGAEEGGCDIQVEKGYKSLLSTNKYSTFASLCCAMSFHIGLFITFLRRDNILDHLSGLVDRKWWQKGKWRKGIESAAAKYPLYVIRVNCFLHPSQANNVLH